MSHTQKLSEKHSLLAEAQWRSADHYAYLNTLLLRTAAIYDLGKAQGLGLGYVYKSDWERMDQEHFIQEHRIFEQYHVAFKQGKIEITLRARLEQRFVKEDDYLFSQRGRAFIGIQFPLLANEDFTKGWYAKFQDELFVNVLHGQLVNGSLLDQNRPYACVGYRISKSADLEIGYMRWFRREMEEDFIRHIMQLMITTSF